jgi:hypothetical protein
MVVSGGLLAPVQPATPREHPAAEVEPADASAGRGAG